MPYKLTKEDLKFDLPKYDKVTKEQLMPLAPYVYPGADAYGLVVDYTSKGSIFYCFIDERYLADNVFFLSSIVVEKSQMSRLSSFIKNFKTKFRPEVPENKWYLKGEGKWLNKDYGKVIADEEEAFTKWVLWANIINKFKEYTLHASITFKKKIKYMSGTKKKKELEYFLKAFESLFLTLTPYKKSQLIIVIDNIEGAQKTAFLNAIESSKRFLNIIDFHIVKKDEKDEDLKNALQFIDMQVYALSRVIFPTEENNILVGFENYIQEIQNKTIMKTLKENGIEYIQALEIKHYVLKKLFTHLRYQLLFNQWMVEFPSKALSSIILNGRKQHLNFGQIVSNRIALLISNYQYKRFNISEYE